MSSSSPAVSKDDAAAAVAGSPLPGHVSATGDREKDKEKEATGPMSALAQLTAIATADISLQDVLADPVALELFKVCLCAWHAVSVTHACLLVSNCITALCFCFLLFRPFVCCVQDEMSKTLSTENVMFLLDARQFKTLNSKALRALLGREIFDNFVANNSRYQVRVCDCDRAFVYAWPLLRARSMQEMNHRCIVTKAFSASCHVLSRSSVP
jgi:hypothetical protein